MTVTELADYLVVSRQNLDGVLTRLERENHVERVPNETDKRTRLVRMTDERWKFWSALEEKISDFYSQAISDFSFDDQVALTYFMSKLLNNLRAIKLSEAVGEAPTELHQSEVPFSR